MNNVQKSCYRDNRIVGLVEYCRALNTEQITALIFRDMKAGQRKAQQRLKRLYETKRLKRCRLAPDAPYCYYLDKRNGRIEHLIALNWVYTWLMVTMPSWETPLCWQYEQDYKILQTDAFFGARNHVTNKARFLFVELDRDNNPWDKIAKYNRLYETEGYRGSWWVEYTDKFPAVLCVTESENRMARIKALIEKENVNGLRFEVKLLDSLIKEVKETCRK
ncbi:MAG: replication-relaxation family protein [Moorella sp. (in: firmicutes)]